MKEEFARFLDWVVYEIYPKSFLDTNGDGVGDLNGVTQKLEYLSALGVNAIWICPIYKSPQKDNGYDVSDYLSLQKEYGDMQDFERLVSLAHEKGIKIIMDLVANHTSEQCFWFQEAKKSRENPYHGYYYFFDTPPNDWQSVFGGSAWEYNEPTGEYYLHSFAKEQPDVNWENPKVREEFEKIVDFWISKGVDGFRCDVLDFIAKDFQKGKMSNGPRLHEYIRGLFGRNCVQKIFTVGECWGGDMLALCAQERKELKTAFRFDHLSVGQTSRFEKKPYTVYEITRILSEWQTRAKEGDFLYPLLTDNHDQPWFLSRFGNDTSLRYECATAFATAIFCLKGVPFLYQGQEFGAVNSKFEDIEKFDDVETRNYYLEHGNERGIMDKINFGNRDNSRRPFAWTKEKNFGFTTAEKAWLPFSSRSSEINVESDLRSKKSVLKYYRALFSLRKENAVLRRGEFEEIRNDLHCFVYLRVLGNTKFLIVFNFEKPTEIENLPNGEFLLGNYQNRICANGNYQPYETAVYKITEK